MTPSDFVVKVTEPASLSRVVEVCWAHRLDKNLAHLPVEQSVTVHSTRSQDGQWSIPLVSASFGGVNAESWPYLRMAVDLAFRNFEERFQ